MASKSGGFVRNGVAVASVLAMLAATATPLGAANPVTAPIVDLGVTVEITPFATIPDGTNPGRPRPRINQFATAGDRLFVVEDFDGLIYELTGEGTSGEASLFFDVKSGIVEATDRELDLTNSFHGGLRGVAFHPEFDANGLFYTSLMETRPANADPADTSVTRSTRSRLTVWSSSGLTTRSRTRSTLRAIARYSESDYR